MMNPPEPGLVGVMGSVDGVPYQVRRDGPQREGRATVVLVADGGRYLLSPSDARRLGTLLLQAAQPDIGRTWP